MTMNNSCMYCTKNENLHHLMIEIAKLEKSTVYLFKEQTYRGRCLVAYDGHVNELYELEDHEFELFMKDVKRVATAMNKAFSPDKINYGAYSDKLSHLHFHLVPKYKDGYSWGSVFEMNPQKVYLSVDEYKNLIAQIKINL